MHLERRTITWIRHQPLKEAGLSRCNISVDTLDPDRFHKMTRLGRMLIEAADSEDFESFRRHYLGQELMGGMFVRA